MCNDCDDAWVMCYLLLLMFYYILYCKLPKYAPPSIFFRTVLKRKWGESICSNIQCIRPLRSLQIFFVLAKSTITTTATEFWKNSSLLNAYYEKSAMLVFKLSHQESKQLASSVVTRDTYAHPVRATKSLVLSSEWGFNIFVCTCLRTPSMMELNQKLTESMPRRRILLPSTVTMGKVCGCFALLFIFHFVLLALNCARLGALKNWLGYVCKCEPSTHRSRMKQPRTFPHNMQQSMSYMYVQNWKPAVTGRSNCQYRDQYSSSFGPADLVLWIEYIPMHVWNAFNFEGSIATKINFIFHVEKKQSEIR